MPGPLLLVDAPAVLYRAFFALPDKIKGADGRPVNALLGACNAILFCVDRYDPRAVVLCFGAEAATYRVEAYAPYHADRPPMPDDLEWQWERAGPLFTAFGWTLAGSEDLEADDLLGSLALSEEAAGGEALILTGDRDMFQCATDRVKVLMQKRGGDGPALMGPAEVEREYGIPPALVPDFIALRGDPSDSLPGAKGIGAKSAADLLQRHGSLEAAIAGAIREKPGVRAALIGQADELRMFKDVATLRIVDIPRPADTPTDRAAGADAAEAIGMARLAERLRGGV